LVTSYITDYFKDGDSYNTKKEVFYNGIRTVRFLESENTNKVNKVFNQEFDKIVNLTSVKQVGLVITNFNGLDNDARIPGLIVNSPSKEPVVANREND
jgi:hypothetical protein